MSIIRIDTDKFDYVKFLGLMKDAIVKCGGSVTEKDTPPDPPKPPTPPPDNDKIKVVEWREMIHHYNPRSLIDSGYPRGKGVSLITCVGDSWKSCTFEGQEFRCQNRNDEGREWWTNIDFRGQKPVDMHGWVIVERMNGQKVKFNIPDLGHSYTDYKGKCFGKK